MQRRKTYKLSYEVQQTIEDGTAASFSQTPNDTLELTC